METDALVTGASGRAVGDVVRDQTSPVMLSPRKAQCSHVGRSRSSRAQPKALPHPAMCLYKNRPMTAESQKSAQQSRKGGQGKGLENDRPFLRRIQKARKSLRAGRGVWLENVK